MYEISEMAMTTPASSAGRVFFCIYYVNTASDEDASFKRAAKTWIAATKSQCRFREGVDIFLEQPVLTEPQFKSAWNGIAQQAANNSMLVWAGNVVSHASKEPDGGDGLEFANLTSDSTITQADFRSLAKMSWHADGYLILSGCNTGLAGAGRTWTPASEFARSQRIRTLGQAAYSTFSKTWSSYTTQAATDTAIALWAYKCRRNNLTGNGARMKGVIAAP